MLCKKRSPHLHNSVIDKECIEFLTDPNEARRQKIIEKVTDNIIDRINGIAPPENAVDQIVDHRKNISEINDNESNQFTDKIE
jgi:hypothetical protein